MRHDGKMIRITILLVCGLLLTSCTQMRTEFYRNETRHLYETGCAHYSQGDYEAAREVFEELITLDPDYGPAYASLGNLAMINEQYELACDYYERAIVHDPELEMDIQPFLAVSTMHRVRKPLVERGIDLAKLYPLLMEKRIDEIEPLLAGDIPLELLAKDSATVTPGQLQEMRGMAIQLIQDRSLSVNFQLFLAYLLFHGEAHDPVVEALLARMLQTAEGGAKQQASLLMGRLQDKMGNNTEAVQHYLAAVRAGSTLEEVAHYLAKIYRVDIETILPSQAGTQAKSKGANMNSHGVSAIPLSAAAGKTTKTEADETVFSFPKPQAVMISLPR